MQRISAASSCIATPVPQRIRRVSPDGIISTVAGTGSLGHDGDNGPATAARLTNPQGVAVAADGTLYLTSAHRSQIGPGPLIIHARHVSTLLLEALRAILD
ncbi:MAG: hypothetical protein MJE77_29870 [Proteobacteria bacterium]|nr:hypothetical protein [Pseudomonadota bacterium]